jgi:hypothetical protein
MYERPHERLLPRAQFFGRLIRNAGYGAALIAFSLAIGMTGYHGLEHLSWTDAFLNASMILSGMGPVAELHTSAAKIFAGVYAIYSGIALISTAAILFAPIVHRGLHKFHLQESKD